MGIKKKRVHINLVGNSSSGKIGGTKGGKGRRKGAVAIKPGTGRPTGRP